MSERELNRIEVLSSVDDGTMTATRAGDLLNLSRRQIQRLVLRLRNEGAGGIRHKARGEPSNNVTNRHKRDYALELIRENYPDFGPTLATEMLGLIRQKFDRSRSGSPVDRQLRLRHCRSYGFVRDKMTTNEPLVTRVIGLGKKFGKLRSPMVNFDAQRML